jgi:hypothetical protein
MYGRNTVAVALLAAIGLLGAACSSTPSSASKSASPAASRSARASTAPVSGGALPAADCVVIRPIAASVVGKLMPLQGEPKAQAAASLKSYITELQTAESQLTSSQAKASLNSLITALERSMTASTAVATQLVTAAISELDTACL